MDNSRPDGAAPPVAVRPGWFPLCLWLHRWTSLIATPFFLVLCLTGSVLIFHEEVEVLFGDRPAAGMGSAVPGLSLDTLAQAAAARRPGHRPLLLFLDPETPDRVLISIGPPKVTLLKEATPLLLDRSNGALLPFSDPRETVTGFLLDLHAHWLLDTPGQIFGGAIALLVLVSLLSGVAIHAPYVRRLAFGTARRGRGTRILQLDLHNFIGVVVLGWVSVVTVTGLLLAAAAILLPVWQNTELREMAGQDVTPATTTVSPDMVAEAAARAMPDRQLRFMTFPGTEFSTPRHYTVGMYGAQRYNERLFEVVLVDAGTGAVTAARPLPWYLQAVLVSEPLHFGDYGGLPLQLLWLASSWGALFITGNGAWLWWRRRVPA